MIVYNYDADLEVSDTCVRSSLLSWVELYRLYHGVVDTPWFIPRYQAIPYLFIVNKISRSYLLLDRKSLLAKQLIIVCKQWTVADDY